MFAMCPTLFDKLFQYDRYWGSCISQSFPGGIATKHPQSSNPEVQTGGPHMETYLATVTGGSHIKRKTQRTNNTIEIPAETNRSQPRGTVAPLWLGVYSCALGPPCDWTRVLQQRGAPQSASRRGWLPDEPLPFASEVVAEYLI